MATAASHHACGSRGGYSGHAQGLDHRVLHGILGGGELLAAPEQPGQHPRCEGPDELVDVVRSRRGAHDQAITTRTSIHS